MEKVRAEDLESFISSPVEVRIHGSANEDQAPWMKRSINKMELCPDETHLRIYFDKYFFFAIPLTSDVKQNESEWSAYDDVARLSYSIRKQ